MATEVIVPELGENVEEGDVVGVLVAVGDTVAKDQPVLELETGKATIEVPSTHAGRVLAVQLAEGDKVRVGQVILTLEEANGAPAAPAAEPAPAPSPPPAPPPEPAEVRSMPSLEPPTPPPSETKPARVPVPAAPSVRKFAREVGVDITQVRGTGLGGRIAVADVKAYAKQLLQSGPSGGAAPGVGPALPDFAQWGPVERTPMTNVRRATAEHMTRSWAAIPHVTQNDKADITRVDGVRKQWARRLEAAGVKLTPTAILLRVVASALHVFPKFNATLDVGNRQIVYKKYIHVGVAVDTPKGLVVPVIRQADQKNALALAAELGELADRARAGKITPDEMTGGTFTITNLGGIGGSHFSPVINFPEVAILGVGRAETEPVFIDGAFEPRLRLPLSLSYDHRLIDGAEAARFLRWIVDAIEEPLLLALEG